MAPAHRPAPTATAAAAAATGAAASSNAAAASLSRGDGGGGGGRGVGAGGSGGGSGGGSSREANQRAQVVARVLKILKTRTRQKGSVRPIFRAMDDDGWGGISHEEFVQCMRRWGLREPAYQLHWVAQAIDSKSNGSIDYDAFSRAMVSNEMEDGMMQPELPHALRVARGEAPMRMHEPEFPDNGPPPFPNAPGSLRGGGAAYGSKYAWSEWGGVPRPSEAAAPPSNPEDVAKAEQRERAKAAAQNPAAARRVQERAEARQRHKVQTVLDTLRRQVEMQGSIAAAFRKLEVSGDSKISQNELARALKSRFNIEMSEETAKGVIREFDIDGDGEIEYREFVQRLLGKFDIDGGDGSGGRNVASGAGGKHVEMAADAAERKAAAARRAGETLDVRRRHAAAKAMDTMKQRLQTKYTNLRDAFRSIDVDSDNTLSYNEFGALIGEWMPELNDEAVRDVCRLLDADGDGMIDFDEFSSVVAAQGDDMRQSTAGLLRAREQKALGDVIRSKGRFGATPSFAYGVQVRELINSFPGAAGYLSDANRFGPSVGQQLVPDWQIADAAKRAQRTQTRREQMRFHLQRQEAVAASRQRTAEQTHDTRMASLLAQRQRYQMSVADENRAKLRAQATFRHTEAKAEVSALQQLTSPRGGA